MFNLGSFAVSEILWGTAQDFSDELLYTLDQLSSGNIEISSDPTEITDKNGNVVRTIYKSKTGTFSATSALLSPAVINASSGSDIEYASQAAPIEMPKITIVNAGATADVSDAKTGSIKVIGIYGNGANGKTLIQGTSASYANGTYKYTTDPNTGAVSVTMPAVADGDPTQYLVKYQRDMESGMKLSNVADKFPNTVRLTLYVAIVDPCSDALRAAYVYAPSAQADPSMTISLDSDSQETDVTYNLQVDYCSTSKDLYYIYFPDEDAVVSGTVGQ